MFFKNVFLIFILVSKSLTSDLYCNKESISPVADPTTLPKLPAEFQTRVQATFNSERTVEFFLVFDYYDQKAEIITQEEIEHDRRVFYYDKNEYFTISNYRKCQVKKINESFDEFNFFGLVYGPDGAINMKPVNDLLHFNNEFPHMYVGQEVYRGIPVKHYRSCQDWIEFNANFLIDFYFSVSEFEQSVGFPDINAQVPVASVIKGSLTRAGRSVLIENTYEFFEFRPFVERKSDLYVQPSGVFCHNQTFKGEMPPIPRSFSFTEEILINDKKMAKSNKVYYSYDLKAIRYDTLATKNYRENAPLKIIHDFNSGVGFVIDEFIGNCSIISLNNDQDSISLANSAGLALTMKDPNQFFFIDDTYFYAGQRLERGIICDVFVSKRTDFKGMIDKQPEYWVFEIYFMAIGQVMESSESEHPVAPIAIKITSSDSCLKVPKKSPKN
ncbi:EF-hand domain-containing D1 [Brachionus plicatilis]|uniref:EF-hand domain-containing D1 n=1 Tax=Brachionus plicatilis TaxID=10195 RepID=A0A3M7P8V6_BRAPC|nr:EF-hand domain-containing D1 [Brachionus plicatilis]